MLGFVSFETEIHSYRCNFALTLHGGLKSSERRGERRALHISRLRCALGGHERSPIDTAAKLSSSSSVRLAAWSVRVASVV